MKSFLWKKALLYTIIMYVLVGIAYMGISNANWGLFIIPLIGAFCTYGYLRGQKSDWEKGVVFGAFAVVASSVIDGVFLLIAYLTNPSSLLLATQNLHISMLYTIPLLLLATGIVGYLAK